LFTAEAVLVFNSLSDPMSSTETSISTSIPQLTLPGGLTYGQSNFLAMLDADFQPAEVVAMSKYKVAAVKILLGADVCHPIHVKSKTSFLRQ
jgi:hypothetical protein